MGAVYDKLRNKKAKQQCKSTWIRKDFTCTSLHADIETAAVFVWLTVVIEAVNRLIGGQGHFRSKGGQRVVPTDESSSFHVGGHVVKARDARQGR